MATRTRTESLAFRKHTELDALFTVLKANAEAISFRAILGKKIDLVGCEYLVGVVGINAATRWPYSVLLACIDSWSRVSLRQEKHLIPRPRKDRKFALEELKNCIGNLACKAITHVLGVSPHFDGACLNHFRRSCFAEGDLAMVLPPIELKQRAELLTNTF